MAEKKKTISDDAVKKATGRTWKEWFALLDQREAQKLAHKDIAALHRLRELHETADGFVAHVNKTFNCSLDQLFEAFKDATQRTTWLAEQGIEVTRASVNKSMRMVWSDGVSRVLVHFYPRGKEKVQVSVEHTRLGSAAEVARAKSSWKSSLERLQQKLSQYG